MKKIFTLCATVLMSLGAFAQSEVGIYRPLDLKILEVGDPAVKEAYGVKITEIRGKDATYREEAGQETTDASDLYIGYNVSQDPTANASASAVYAADNVIYPIVAEQTERQAEEYFGFTMDIPEGKSVNIEALDVYLLLGNAYYWQVEITDAQGNVVYKTQDEGIKNNSYNKTAYTNAIYVTTTEVSAAEWSQKILESWEMDKNYSVDKTEVLPELKNLTGTYTVKVYYWGKWQKNMTYANVYLTISEGTTGISSIEAENANSNKLYNLAGQRVDKNYKGIVIKDGKKFIVK